MSIDDAVNTAIDSSNAIRSTDRRDVFISGGGIRGGYMVTIALDVRGNLTMNDVYDILDEGGNRRPLHRMRDGMFQDVRDIVGVLQARNDLDEVTMIWALPYVDARGNEDFVNVFRLIFITTEIDEIDFANFSNDTLSFVSDIAGSAYNW